MAEFRIHWPENGVIRYSWQPTMRKAQAECQRIRRRTGLSCLELNSYENVVRFNLHGCSKRELMDFLNEHVAYGPDVTPARKIA